MVFWIGEDRVKSVTGRCYGSWSGLQVERKLTGIIVICYVSIVEREKYDGPVLLNIMRSGDNIK